ncbi:MAG: hypothetical protein VBE63_20400 [Lamprobacter sp.]|uniref:hypothetical protein n=1 Tax=Lamprobacter sp. TaxID=3100796 RepID=UPI002B25877C|nr:hypothetical protein [Lamprobacter sp.]MEA3642280.1 hypothetical protein [Lamprobacter sp.]
MRAFIGAVSAVDQRRASQGSAWVQLAFRLVECINVVEDSAEEIGRYCSHPCWSSVEADWIAALSLTRPYSPAGLAVPCSRCGTLVDRLRVHVAYNLSDECYVEEPDGSLSVKTNDENTLAVLCNRCESPGAEAETQEQASRPEIATA